MPTIKYTDATIVKAKVKGTVDLSTANIETMIEETEGYLDAYMRETFLFDAAKHGLLREAASSYVACKIIAAEPDNYASTSEASLAADILWATARRCEILLRDDPKTVIFLKGR